METFGENLFVATNEGLSVFTTDADFPLPLLTNNFTATNGLSSVDVKELELTQDGYVVCANIDGLDYCEIDSMMVVSSWHFLSYDDIDDDENITLSDLSVYGNKLALATDVGIYVIDDFPHSLEVQHISSSNGLESDYIYPIYVDAEENIWFSYGTWDSVDLLLENTTSTAVVRLSPTGEKTQWDNEAITEKITGFTTASGQIAAFTWGEGFYLLDSSEWTNHKPESIIANTVTQLATDQNGIIWMVNGYRGSATTSKGTRGVSGYDVQNDIWFNYEKDNSPLLSNNMFSVGVDAQNRKYFGTWSSAVPGWDEGISVLDDSQDEPAWSVINTGLLNTTISFIISDPGYSSKYTADNWVGFLR